MFFRLLTNSCPKNKKTAYQVMLFYLLLAIGLSLKPCLARMPSGAALASEPNAPGDVNGDYEEDLTDIVLFNIYLYDLSQGRPLNPDTLKNLDADWDGKADSLDLEYFLTYMKPNYYYDTYWPYYFYIDSYPALPSMSAEVKEFAGRQLDWIAKNNPGISHWLRHLRRQLNLIEMPPVSQNGDINRDGRIEMLDMALFFHYLADSVATLSMEHPVIKHLDYNADGRVDVMDTQSFLVYNYLNLSPISGQSPIKLSETFPGSFVWSPGIKSFAEEQFAWVINATDAELANKLALIREYMGLESSPPAMLPGDINHDFKRSLTDVVKFFNYLGDGSGKQQDGTGIFYRCDLNYDRVVDLTDVEYFFFFYFIENNSPAESDSSLLRISPAAEQSAFRQFDKFQASNPEWKTKISDLREGLSRVPVSEFNRCDINRDGRVNIVDAIALIVLGSNNDPSADWNGDGGFGISDVVSYIMDVRDGRCD